MTIFRIEPSTACQLIENLIADKVMPAVALLSVPLVGKLFDALYVFSGIFFHRVDFF